MLALAFFAGLVDAVAGGGGLIQVPALFAAYPEVPPATLMSTNKVAAIGGTLNAARRYLRHVNLPWAIVGPAIGFGFFGALLGAQAVAVLPALGVGAGDVVNGASSSTIVLTVPSDV